MGNNSCRYRQDCSTYPSFDLNILFLQTETILSPEFFQEQMGDVLKYGFFTIIITPTVIVNVTVSIFVFRYKMLHKEERSFCYLQMQSFSLRA